LIGTLQACCDLGQLWYREFYLEMTKGERIQVDFVWFLVQLTASEHLVVKEFLYVLTLRRPEIGENKM